MDRRHFLLSSALAVFSSLAAGSGGLSKLSAQPMPDDTDPPGDDYDVPDPDDMVPKDDPVPRPEITAAVNVIVPPDPDIPGDFSGADYGADKVLAKVLGTTGMAACTFHLNQFSQQVAGKGFMECTPQEQLDAIKQWIIERDQIEPIFADLLTGLVTVSMIGTYEENSEDEQRILFESMGWFDPEDPGGTFRLPCEGYPDSYQFPVKLREGLRNE